MTLSVDAGLSKQRDIHMFDARRIEQAHRHRLQKATKFQEYLDLEDSGNSDPLVQIEKIKNVIKKTTTTSKDEQKLVDWNYLEVQGDFLNNVNYAIVDENKSLPLMSKVNSDHN